MAPMTPLFTQKTLRHKQHKQTLNIANVNNNLRGQHTLPVRDHFKDWAPADCYAEPFNDPSPTHMDFDSKSEMTNFLIIQTSSLTAV